MRIDFRMSPDGDLEVGSPKIDNFGQLLYMNSAGDYVEDSSEGNLVRDIPLHVSHNAEKQIILNRLKTDNPDWYHHQTIGADLSQLNGMPNNRTTGELGVQLIEQSLTHDGFLDKTNLKIRPVPISPEEILFHITVMRKSNLEDIVLPILYNVVHGVLTEYEVKS